MDAQQSKSASSSSSVGKDNTGLTGSLKSNREGANVTSVAAAAGSSRLLHSALQSSRASKADTIAAANSKRAAFEKEGGDNKNKRVKSNGDQNKRHIVLPNQHSHQQSQQPSFNFQQQQQFQPRGVMDSLGAGGEGMDTVKYFAQINEVALMSGFRNAQEMLASQKEMMSIMHGGPAALPPHIPPAFPPAYPHHPPAQFAGSRHYNAHGRGRGG